MKDITGCEGMGISLETSMGKLPPYWEGCGVDLV